MYQINTCIPSIYTILYVNYISIKMKKKSQWFEIHLPAWNPREKERNGFTYKNEGS